MATPTQTRRIIIKVDTADSKGLREIADKMGLLNRNTKSLAGNMSFLTNAFKGWLGYLGVRELINISDSMQNLGNRLKIITTDGKSSGEVLQNISDIATRTLQPLDDVGTAYVRMGSALKGAKLNTEQLSAVTESLITTFRVAGTTTAETTNTMVQLSQAFASGTLRGDELRSVMEQNAVIAGYLREEFKKFGGVSAAAKAGLVQASDVIKVLVKNFDDLYNQNKKLTPTFEQAANILKNDLYLGILSVNQQFGISVKVFEAALFIVKNLDAVLLGLATTIGILATVKLVEFIAALRAVDFSIKALLLTNPVGWAIAAGAAIASLTIYVGGLSNAFLYLQYYALETSDTMIKIASKLPGVFKVAALAVEATLDNVAEKQKNILKEIDRNNKSSATQTEDQRKKQQKEFLQQAYEQQKAYEETFKKAAKVKDVLAALNKELLAGSITILQYNEKLINFQLFKLNKEFADGKLDVFKYHEGLRDLNLEELNRELKAGTISLQQFNVQASSEKLKVLDEQFKAGKISIAKYHEELTKLEDKVRGGSVIYTGVNNYLTSIGTLAQGIAKTIEGAFGHLETQFLNFVKTGKSSFEEFAQAVLDDLAKIIYRSLIIAPLAKGILGAIGSPGAAGEIPTGVSSGHGPNLTGAKGLAFENGYRKFASGGIVSSPTAFSYGGGKPGLMGEAGTEAILPLARGSNGDLGVQASLNPVTINIINQSGASVEQRDSVGANGERTIDIIIASKVREGIASGKFDTAMKQSYGLNRKGS